MKKLSKTLVAFVLVALIAVVASVNTVSAAESVFPKGYEKIPVSRRTELAKQADKETGGDGYLGITVKEIEQNIIERFNIRGEAGISDFAKRYIELLEEEIGTAGTISVVQKANTWKVIDSGTKIYAKQLVKAVNNSGKVTYKFDDGSEYKTVSTTGEKEFTVVATDAEGNKAEKTVTVNCKKGDRPLMTLYDFDVYYNSKNKSFTAYFKAGEKVDKLEGDWFIATDCNGDLVKVANNAKDVSPKVLKAGQSKTITFTATDKYNNVSKAKVKVTAISAKKWKKEHEKWESKYLSSEHGFSDHASMTTPDNWHAKILVQIKGTKVVKEVLNSYTKKKTTINTHKGTWYFSNHKGFNAFDAYCCRGNGLYNQLIESGYQVYIKVGKYGVNSTDPGAWGISDSATSPWF